MRDQVVDFVSMFFGRLSWVMVTSWTPHRMLARYWLRFLQDPQRVFGCIEWIHALGRENLDLESPEVAGFVTRFHLADQEMSDLLLQASDLSAVVAVDAYLNTHQVRVRYWRITGEIGPGRSPTTPEAVIS